jgi:hypothetical protein
MNLFGLIIQRTTSGLNDMFVSDNLKEIRNSSEIEKTTDDENKYATKLANQSDVYTVQLTTNYRIYSLVITDATDSFGRAGFYAIRLYTPKKYPLANFHIILQQINKKYLEFDSNGTPKSSQEYDNLLKFDIPLEVKQQDFIHVKSNDNAFCYYDSSNTQLSNIFNAKGIALYNKVYAFNKEKAVDSNLIKSLDLKPLEESKNNFKEVIINNNYRVLKELKVNNNPIEFNSNETDFTVLVNKEDIIEYNTIDEPKFKQDTSLIINVQRKHYAPPPSRPRGQKKPGFFESYGLYFIMAFMIMALGIGSWYFLLGGNAPDSDNENNNNIIQESTLPDQTVKTVLDSSKIEFIADGSIKDSSVFKTLYPKLDKYRFILDNNKWSYKNTKGKNKYVEFYKSNLDEIIRIDSLKFNDSLKINFFKNLEKIGGHEILEKEKKIINTPEKKKSETGGTTTKKSSKKEESKKTLQKKEQKSQPETDSKTEVKKKKTNIG